jgi:hypothetical protein
MLYHLKQHPAVLSGKVGANVQQEWFRYKYSLSLQNFDRLARFNFLEFRIKSIMDYLPTFLRCHIAGNLAQMFKGKMRNTGYELGVNQVFQNPPLKQDACSGSGTICVGISKRSANRQNVVAGYSGATFWEISQIRRVRMVAYMVTYVITKLSLPLSNSAAQGNWKQYPLIEITKPFPDTFAGTGILAYQDPPWSQCFHRVSTASQTVRQEAGKAQHALLAIWRIITN